MTFSNIKQSIPSRFLMKMDLDQAIDDLSIPDVVPLDSWKETRTEQANACENFIKDQRSGKDA